MPDPFRSAFGKNPVKYDWDPDTPWVKDLGHDPVDSSSMWYKFHQPPFDPYSMSWPQISDLNKSMESMEEQEGKFQKDMKKHKDLLPFRFPEFGKGATPAPNQQIIDESKNRMSRERFREGLNNPIFRRK